MNTWVAGIDDMQNPDEWDQENGPAWQFDNTNNSEEETVFATPSGYSFCPAPHHSQALHIFTKHFCEHPLLPGRDGRYRVAKKICDDAVHKMYMFCYRSGSYEATCRHCGTVSRSGSYGHARPHRIFANFEQS